MLTSSFWPETGSLPISVLSGGVVVVETEPLGDSASDGALDMTSLLAVEVVSWEEAANIHPTEVSKTISNVIVNAENQLFLFMFTKYYLV